MYWPSRKKRPDCATLLREALRQGNPIDVVLAALHDQGASKVESIKAVHDVMAVSLTEAKKLVDKATDDFKPKR
jgi:ribosomal protein L7/L12